MGSFSFYIKDKQYIASCTGEILFAVLVLDWVAVIL